MLSLQSLCHIYCCLLDNLVFVLKISNYQCHWMDTWTRGESMHSLKTSASSNACQYELCALSNILQCGKYYLNFPHGGNNVDIPHCIKNNHMFPK